MSGLIPENILEDILSRVNIVEVISGHIPLKRAGRNFKALCPFHHEKTPSFMVSPDRQIYHCFSCGAGGNAFNFLMKYERLEFREAVELLAKKVGVELPVLQKEDIQAVNLSTQLYKINELAAIFYESNLNSTIGAQAKNYLFKRGIKESAVKSLKLGFATDKWDGLINYLRAKGISIGLLEKAGLVLSKQGGGYYDRFRNRIIFPIFDIKSRVLGFGARVLDDTLPKYINSPETPVYIKGRHLYGFHLAKDAVRENDFIAVVEGNLDFLMPYQEGFQNIVASLGTALTEEQVHLLKRYTNNVVMIYDGDAAGEMATLRSLDIFIEEEMSVKVVSLPEGFDPDLFVRENGVENFRDKITQAKTLFDYKLGILKSRYGPSTIEAKAKISAEMLVTIDKFKNAVLKSEYLKKLAQELNVKEEALMQELKNVKEEKNYTDFVKPESQKTINIHPTEKLLIRLMLEEKGLIDSVRDKLEPADFQDERVSRIVSLMFNMVEQGKKIEPNILINRLGDDNLLQLICESTFAPEVSGEDKEKVVNDCVMRLKSMNLTLKRKRLEEEMKIAENSGDEERLNGLRNEFHQLIKKG